jgi:hypothetical protein
MLKVTTITTLVDTAFVAIPDTVILPVDASIDGVCHPVDPALVYAAVIVNLGNVVDVVVYVAEDEPTNTVGVD